MKKRALLNLVLFVSLVIFLLSCSSAPSSSPGSPESGPNQSSNDSPPEKETSKPDKYKVGVVMPLSGSAAENGEDAVAGVEFAANEINKKGGIGGIAVEIIAEDGKALPKESVNSVQKLITVDKVPAILSGFSSPLLAAAPIAEQNKVLLVQAGAASPRLADASSFLINATVLQNVELDYLTKYTHDELGLSKMAVIYQNNDLGLGIKEALEKYMSNLGGSVVSAESFEVGAVDYRTQLTKIRDSKPDMLYIAAAGKDVPLIIKQSREYGLDALLLSYHVFQMPEEYRVIAGDAATGAIFTSSTSSVDPDFIQRWKDEVGKELVDISAAYYDAANMVFQGMEYADKNGYGVTGEGIRKAIFEIGEFDGATGKMRIPDTGNAIKKIEIKKIDKEGYTTLKTIEP